MQYLLTEQEYDALRKAPSIEAAKWYEKLATVCKLAAMHAPVASGWMAGKPWGCPHVPKSGMEYCDDCPVKESCPLEKYWSK